MIMASSNRAIAMLSSINGANFQQSLAAFRQVRAVNAVASLQLRSSEQGTDSITMDEIDAEINAVRKKRARAR